MLQCNQRIQVCPNYDYFWNNIRFRYTHVYILWVPCHYFFPYFQLVFPFAICACAITMLMNVLFAHFFFNKQNKNQSSLVTRNILPPHIARSILLTCKNRVDMLYILWRKLFCERTLFCLCLVVSFLLLTSWIIL